ncbi:MAG: 30S ribosomal protein S6 [Candidatus Omnitrophica bacterium]|nr:30S ribosomal protein S6 [Candidatus Gastranaerophilales bacterium]MDD5070454.1 30S ribosomal protein S6 [Candidatus Omnitrophota bacterium]
MVRVYESMMILMPDLDDAGREEVFQKVTKKIEELEGKMLLSKIWAKEHEFCFTIKSRGADRKDCRSGCYWLINFSLNTEKLPDLKEMIRLEERILRNNLIRNDKAN